MQLTSLKLQHFRSYPKAAFTFSPYTTLLMGPNTVGKTNILEAIMVMATGKSFRADKESEMIRLGQMVARIHVVVEDTMLDVVLTQGTEEGVRAQKKFLVNGVARRVIDFLGNLRVVLFWPEHLELVTDSPSLRRKYLDSVLVQTDREYSRNLLSYERGLRQRNKLLDLINEGKASRNQLLFWNQLLIRSGNYLTDSRLRYIEFVNAYNVSGMAYQIVYDKSVISEARLDQYRDEEVAAKATLVGPHRDDFSVHKQKARSVTLDLSKFGSRGEQRLAVLWLKLAELAYMQHAVGQRPILLLDDIFSELDHEHRDLVLDVIEKQQTIMTSADPETLTLMKHKKGQKYEVIHLVLPS